MPDQLDLDQLRERLYAAYATTHAGVSDVESQAPGFRRDVKPHLPRDLSVRILDLGCGQGHYVRLLLALGYEHTRGIDVSPEQVQTAHASGLTQVNLGDYRNSLGQAELDVVVATDFFEHLTRFEAVQALDRIKAALRPGGTLILRVPNAVSPFGGRLRYGDVTHETSFTPGSLRQLAAATGLTAIEIRACPPPIHGVISALRAGVWWAVAGLIKMALTAETGQVRGHVVTQNMVAIMRLDGRQSLRAG